VKIPTPNQAAPELTKEEKLELENYQLKNVLLEQQRTQLQTQYAQFMQEVEKNHPGYRLISGPQGSNLVSKDMEKPSIPRPPHSVTH
jgi:hypothetical protein